MLQSSWTARAEQASDINGSGKSAKGERSTWGSSAESKI
jgi:hypothetical protein